MIEKNENKVRTTFGYNLLFEDYGMARRFIDLYGDLFVDHDIAQMDSKYTLVHILYNQKGVIDTIKNGLAGMIRSGKHHMLIVGKEEA